MATAVFVTRAPLSVASATQGPPEWQRQHMGGLVRTPSLGGQGALVDGQLSRARFVAEATPCVQGLHCCIVG